jgi:hypothetical protein
LPKDFTDAGIVSIDNEELPSKQDLTKDVIYAGIFSIDTDDGSSKQRI